MKIFSLEYHDVYDGHDPDASGFPGAGPASYKLPLDAFRRHVSAISATRATVIRIDGTDLGNLPEWPACITFDDGGCGAMLAADALEGHGLPGHFFVTSASIGRRTFLGREQIRELWSRGHVIGSHSVSHPKMMGSMTEAEVLQEWRDSLATLEDIVGAPVAVASVPGGFFRPHVGSAAAAAGVKTLFTSNPTSRADWIDGCCILGRYTVRAGTSAPTAAAIAAGRLPQRAFQSVLYGTLTVARSVAGPYYTTLRDAFWARR